MPFMQDMTLTEQFQRLTHNDLMTDIIGLIVKLST